MQKKKNVILIMPYDITYFPPILSLCNILNVLNYNVVYVGACSNFHTETQLRELNVKIYKYKYGGNGLKRFFQQIKFRQEARKIIKREYSEGNSFIWLLHTETISLFASLIGKYKIIAHLLEFKNPRDKLVYRLLSPIANIKKRLKNADKVICSEYNRAQLVKSIYHLNQSPYVMPNKSYYNVTENSSLPIEIKNILSTYQGKKIILYQGVFIPERKLDDYIEAIQYLPEEYVLFLMGNETGCYRFLKEKYASPRIVFLPFLPPPLHLEVTKSAHIGIITYIPKAGNLMQSINVLYCAPNKIYEYSKFGIPMITNDLPAIRYSFANYTAGICLNELNAKEICKAIIAIENNYNHYSNEAFRLYNSVDMFEIVRNILE
jgi:glycosyltransferase involved in cell wall biosynthesis